MSENENIIEKYITYVESIIGKYSKASKLIEGDEVTPYALNSALANYMETNMALIAEYQRKKIELYNITKEYDMWYDDCFVRTRNQMIKDSEAKTIKIAVKEIESQLKVDNQKEYYEWQDYIKEAEYKVRFLNRLLDQYKKFDNVLVNLSSNMRQEMRSLSVENRVNADPQAVAKRRIRSEFRSDGEN